jgi:hemolysin-activating ACP:hemolysin acyltransferase
MILGQRKSTTSAEPLPAVKGADIMEAAKPVPAAQQSSKSASQQTPAQLGNGGGSAIPEKDRRQAMAALRNSLAFTQIIGVLMRSEHYKHYTLGDLEWLVVPPMLAGQYRIGEAKPKTGGSIPVAVVLWARVSADVDKRLAQIGRAPIKLRPDEWTSGDILWLVHAAGAPRFVRHVLKQLSETAFKGREVKFRGFSKDGKPEVHLLPADAQGEPKL